MPKVHIVIGDADTRKSSTLRCLTGYHGKRPLQSVIHIADGQNKPFAAVIRLAALQEGKLVDSPLIITPDDFINRKWQPDIQIVIALRVVGTTHCRYDAAAYLQAMQNGYSVESIALLGSASVAQQHVYTALCPHAVVVLIPNSAMEPSNAIAAQIRGPWQWR